MGARYTDDEIFALMERFTGAPLLQLRDTRFAYCDGIVIVERRMGKGDRWTWQPERDTYSLSRFLGAYQFPREAHTWALQAKVFDVAVSARAHAMAMRTL